MYLFAGAEWDTVQSLTARHEVGHGNAIECESALLLYALVHRYDPITVVETGTHFGFSSAAIASALADRESFQPKGRMIHTMDMHSYDQKPEKLWDAIGVSHVVKHYIADTLEKPPRQILPPLAGTVDFLWLDASHAAEDVITEFQRFAPLLNRERAIVGFHDTTLDPREAEGIRQILNGPMSPINEYKFASFVPIRNMRGIDFLFLSNEELGF